MRKILFSVIALGALTTAALSKNIVGTPGDDLLNGTSDSDEIQGLGGHDEILGREGDDLLAGGDGNDEVFGGDGGDTADGGAGNDQLDGRGGNDTLTGGAGRDVLFYYARVDNGDDTLTDFDGAEDTILLDGFTAADVEARTENGEQVIVLGDRGQITLLGVARIDDNPASRAGNRSSGARRRTPAPLDRCPDGRGRAYAAGQASTLRRPLAATYQS